jgi:hypothetical protein
MKRAEQLPVALWKVHNITDASLTSNVHQAAAHDRPAAVWCNVSQAACPTVLVVFRATNISSPG